MGHKKLLPKSVFNYCSIILQSETFQKAQKNKAEPFILKSAASGEMQKTLEYKEKLCNDNHLFFNKRKGTKMKSVGENFTAPSLVAIN